MLVHGGETPMRGIVRRLQLEPPAVFLKCLLVAACADKDAAKTDVSRRKRGVTFGALPAILYSCVRPLFVMRQLVFAPVGFAQARVGRGKSRVLLKGIVENFDSILNIFELDVVLQIAAPLQIKIVRSRLRRAVRLQRALLLRLQLQFQRVGHTLGYLVLQRKGIAARRGDGSSAQLLV